MPTNGPSSQELERAPPYGSITKRQRLSCACVKVKFVVTKLSGFYSGELVQAIKMFRFDLPFDLTNRKTVLLQDSGLLFRMFACDVMTRENFRSACIIPSLHPSKPSNFVPIEYLVPEQVASPVYSILLARLSPPLH